MSDLTCPRCGGAIRWGESSCVPGAIGHASCLMGDPRIRADKRNDCTWAGAVIRLPDGEGVRIATDDEVAAERARQGVCDAF